MRVLQLALCLLALVALASAVPTAIHPLAHRMRLPQQHTKGSSSSSSSSSSLAFQNKKSPEALFQLSPDYVVPYITIDFDPEVKASDALQRVTEVIKSTKQTESHFLVAANFDADEIEKSNAKLAKAADAEAQLLKDLAALVEKKQGAKSVLDDPKVQEALKTKKSEQKVDEVTKKLHTEQKQAVKPEENLAALKTHFLLAGAKPADLKVGAAYIVRVEVKKFPDDKQLDLLKKAIDALTKDFSKVSGVVKAYASTAAVNPFACIAPGNGNTPCDGTQYNDVPDMTPWQATYLDATTGVNWNAMKAKNIPGTDGSNVRFIDIESDFDDQHVNLPAVGKVAAQGLQPAPSYPRDADNMDHGSAVLGMLVATGKIGGVGTKGMKGMVPAAAPHFTTRFIKPAGSFVIDEGSAVERVVDNMNPTYGDVIILEMQRPFSGVGTCGNPLYYNVGPVEGVAAVRDKIKVALANGAVVVAAGGNGAVDLDDATCQTFFKMNPHTIIVGAATSAAVNNKQLEVWSVKGARVDVHALGSDIATLGFRNDPYGRGAYRDDLLNALVAPQPNSPHHDYTHVFGGTSGATPQVAAVAIAMAGIMKHYDLQIPPSTFQSIIRSTATTAIGGAAGGSGGLLNAEAAVDKMLATVRKCRYCQFSLTRTMPLNILMSIMTTDDAAKFTCSKLGGEKAECEKFINWVSLHLYLQSPTNHKDATFGSELADIAMKLVGNVNPSNAEAVRVIDSVCTASVGSPCKLSQAHYGAWVAQHSTHPYLADSATRALSN